MKKIVCTVRNAVRGVFPRGGGGGVWGGGGDVDGDGEWGPQDAAHWQVWGGTYPGG